MTAVLAINCLHKIIVVSDCRVTWRRDGTSLLQDNIQKLYPLNKQAIIGFSGDLKAAQKVMVSIRAHLNSQPVSYMGIALAEVVSELARNEYMTFDDQGQSEKLQLMLAGPLRPNIRSNIGSLLEVGLFQLDSPSFDIEQKKNSVKLGYARDYPDENVESLRNTLLPKSNSELEDKFHNTIAIWTSAEELVKVGGDEVGECFIGGSINLDGPKWQQYGREDHIEVKIKEGRFFICDSKKKTEVPLKTIFEYDVSEPLGTDVVFGSPFTDS